MDLKIVFNLLCSQQKKILIRYLQSLRSLGAIGKLQSLATSDGMTTPRLRQSLALSKSYAGRHSISAIVQQCSYLVRILSTVD